MRMQFVVQLLTHRIRTRSLAVFRIVILNDKINVLTVYGSNIIIAMNNKANTRQLQHVINNKANTR